MECKNCHSNSGVVEPTGYHATCSHATGICTNIYCKAIILAYKANRVNPYNTHGVGKFKPEDVLALCVVKVSEY
jgi:hypothetical protein